MGFTPEQIKGRIKSVAKQNNADARTLMRIYIEVFNDERVKIRFTFEDTLKSYETG